MAGWRVGFCAGNVKIVKALSRIKNFVDYGVYGPIQHAAAWALDNGDQLVVDICQQYDRRRSALVQALNHGGWEVNKPRGTMFVWAPIPERFRYLGSVAFASKFLKEADIAVAPGAGFVAPGVGMDGGADEYVRFALIEADRYNDVETRVRNFLSQG